MDTANPEAAIGMAGCGTLAFCICPKNDVDETRLKKRCIEAVESKIGSS